MVAKRSHLSARDRLLAAADELFYSEGIHTVGIDRIIAHAGVAKASLYGAFENKEDLVRTYLELRADRRRRHIEEHVAKASTTRAKLLAVFDALETRVKEPAFRGCAFINASAEGNPSEKVTSVCDRTRAYLVELLTDLGKAHGVKAPAELAKRLALLYDGALVSASVDRDLEAPARAKEMAELLVDAS